MTRRKTIEIKALIEKTNACMVNSPDDARMERLAIVSFLSSVLMDANSYAGFGYLKDYHDPANDSSRVFFYVPNHCQ